MKLSVPVKPAAGTYWKEPSGWSVSEPWLGSVWLISWTGALWSLARIPWFADTARVPVVPVW